MSENNTNTSLSNIPSSFDFDTDTNVVDFTNVLLPVMSVLWILPNILSITVFVKQGLNTSTNIALTALALVDICNIVFTSGSFLLVSPWVDAAVHDTFVPVEMGAVFSFLHIVFVPMKAWINVFMTAERCLCIALPLKIKQIINPRQTVMSLFGMFLLICSPAIAEYSDIYLDWRFYPIVNKTLIGVVYRHSRDYIEEPVYYTLSTVLLTSFPVLILLTSILIYKLLKMSKWRKKSITKTDQIESLDLRDRTVIRLVVVIASCLIVSLTPCVILYSLSYTIQGFSLFGIYAKAFLLLGKISYVFDATNSSLNIFIYYKMSSNFKQTFQQIFCPA